MKIRPKDGGPQLAAEISVFTPADALQWATSSELTGRLAFRSDETRIQLLFDRGGLVHASSSQRLAAFGSHLFSQGLIDEVDQAAAMVYSRDNQSRIGAAMVELGVLEASIVRNELRDHTVNLAVVPISWKKGWVSADTTPFEIDSHLAPEAVDTTFVLMEAARRIDEMKVIRETLPHDGIVTAVGSGQLPRRASAHWKRALAVHESGSSLEQHYERLGGSHYRFLETIHEMVEQAVLTVEAPAAEPDTGNAREAG